MNKPYKKKKGGETFFLFIKGKEFCTFQKGNYWRRIRTGKFPCTLNIPMNHGHNIFFVC